MRSLDEAMTIKAGILGTLARRGEAAAMTLTAAHALSLAGEIMELLSRRTDDPVVAATAQWRALAGFYARLTLDAGDGADTAELALGMNCIEAAGLAGELCRNELVRRGQEAVHG
jgi:hypothetical protein